jgi:prepilin signal peptidase PulO-like enzyme (type II secretory pathway)
MATAEALVAGLWMLAICVYDLRELRIPNYLLVIGLVLAGLYAGVNGEATHAIWGLIVGLAVMVTVSQVWAFAPGDQKLAGAIGAFVGGTGVLIAIGVALVAVGCWISYRRPRREAFPFSPFLALGALVAYGAVG